MPIVYLIDDGTRSDGLANKTGKTVGCTKRSDRNKNINRKRTLIKIVTAVIITRTVMIHDRKYYWTNDII